MLRYKACRNSIVILELLKDSVTNEKRDGIVDDKYAKFRCDKAKVINITYVKTGETMENDNSIFNNSFRYFSGEIVETCFNENMNEVCTDGIHYFKTEEAAVSWFYKQDDRFPPDGKCEVWYENGQKDSEGTFKNGKLDGKLIGWYENGQKHYEATYKNGKKHGKCTQWAPDGNKVFEGTFRNRKASHLDES